MTEAKLFLDKVGIISKRYVFNKGAKVKKRVFLEYENLIQAKRHIIEDGQCNDQGEKLAFPNLDVCWFNPYLASSPDRFSQSNCFNHIGPICLKDAVLASRALLF